MKKLLLALPISLVLLSIAQAQQIETEQDLLNGMLHQMAGQLYDKPANPADSPLIQALETDKQQSRVVDSNRVSQPQTSLTRNTKPMTRPILID